MQEAYCPPCSKSFVGGGLPTLDGPWPGWVPTLAGVPTLAWRGTYLGLGVPTLARGYLPGPGGIYLGWGTYHG